MTDWLSLSRLLIETREADTPVSWHSGRVYSHQHFTQSVMQWTDRFKTQSDQNYVLYCHDAYPFAILLFALWHAGKTVWLPGANRPGMLEQLPLNCQILGDWDKEFDYALDSSDYKHVPLTPLPTQTPQTVIFTSGSSGEAKPIAKSLTQLQRELDTLEACWGALLNGASALATVSHQHIYGLLFRVLWPLSAGRCFHSAIYYDPEHLLSAVGQEQAYWIASPAQLKRLQTDSPWSQIAGLQAIFSSGGVLSAAALQQIKMASNQTVLEVYGSSETGGIGWRESDQAWRLFPGLQLVRQGERTVLYSPYLPENANLELADQIELLENGQFLLSGRLDRIVKIEEKRLSLSEMEQRLLSLPWISEAFLLTASTHRDIVAATLVLSAQGETRWSEEGRHRFIQRLRKALGNWFEAVLLPRKWLFADAIPLTSQAKINQALLKAVVFADNKKLPQVLSMKSADAEIQLALKVSADLIYFAGHFASYPILPGVVQIAWVEYYGQQFFEVIQPFSHMEVIKFMQLIVPGDELVLRLNWKPDIGKLYFQFDSATGLRSSGRMVYGNSV